MKAIYKNFMEDLQNNPLIQSMNLGHGSKSILDHPTKLPEILFVSSYPPRECGIATYSQDLIRAIQNKFVDSFNVSVCALEDGQKNFDYPPEVKFVLDTTFSKGYKDLAHSINSDNAIKSVVFQHEFGFFQSEGEDAFLDLLFLIRKPIVMVFHTVLPKPNKEMFTNIKLIVSSCNSIVVMTNHASHILQSEYDVPSSKIDVIAHGTHLVPHLSKSELKDKFGLKGKKVLATFGLLSSGKGIDITLQSLPKIIQQHPEVVFLILGKTHPTVVKEEGEKYREMLQNKIIELRLEEHVVFCNKYLPLNELLTYLQLTDIYLFTSRDPNQAVSGTFAYAISCGCPIISTPIPHAKEVLSEGFGLIVDFEQVDQLSDAVNKLLLDDELRTAFTKNTLQRMAPTAWENSAISFAELFQKISKKQVVSTYPSFKLKLPIPKDARIKLCFKLPPINLSHMHNLTTSIGMIQFSKINQPDIESGYALDDNARALIAFVMHYELTGQKSCLEPIFIYLNFIQNCQQVNGGFLNYLNSNCEFTSQNDLENLEDANGRAIWALGFMVSRSNLFPQEINQQVESILSNAYSKIASIHSSRAMAFAIKGLYYANLSEKKLVRTNLIIKLANRLLEMYNHESEPEWEWFESYLTYANGILPEAMLCAYQETKNEVYKVVADASFEFLLSKMFFQDQIKLISNQSWLHKGGISDVHGQQPIDVAYTILALQRFYEVENVPSYLEKIVIAFNWFLGKNHLHQIIYNPCTGGCYDGLEETQVNLNQGAESTISYLLSRLTIEKLNMPQNSFFYN